jgi:DNA recombination protein RmuC
MEVQSQMVILAATAVMVLLGLLFACWLGYRSKKSELQSLQQRSDEAQGSLQQQLDEERESLLAKDERYNVLYEEKTTLERDFAVLHTRFEDATRTHEEKLRLLEEAKAEMKTQFENLANEIFEKKNRSFDESNQKRLDLLLKPFREQIAQFAKQSQDRFVEESKERHLLKDEIFRLKLLNERISEDALNLTNALKGENKTQGNWGEIVLERILEESGLREGFEYETQSSYKGEEGRTMRPDVIVHLPQEKDIVIDSKVSLVAYETFMKADDPSEKERALKQHLASIHAHIKGLSEKRYEKLDGVRTLDFVLLFMPIEGAFLLALEQDSTFFKTAYEHNIMVVSPSTLLVTLRTIEHIWRTERQEQNAQEIARQAEALYDKFVLFVEDMHKIGEQIGRTQDTYDKAMNKLQSGRGNLIRRAESMKKLGLKPKKSLAIAADGEDEA